MSSLPGDVVVSVNRATAITGASARVGQTIVIVLDSQCDNEMLTQTPSGTTPPTLKAIKEQLATVAGGVLARSYLAVQAGTATVTIAATPRCTPSARCPWSPPTTIGTVRLTITR